MRMFLMVAVGVMVFCEFLLLVHVGRRWLLAFLKKRASEDSVRKERKRLLNPRWGELEEHFGCPIPQGVKNLYRQKKLLFQQDFILSEGNGKEWYVAEFLPADVEAQHKVLPDSKKSTNFAFALDLAGDCYYIPLAGNKADRCPVMYYHGDGRDVELVANSLDEFLGWHQTI